MQRVEFAPDPGRAHRVAQHLQTLAQVLQAAEGHVANGNMRADPARGPVIDGADFQIVFVSAEARFEVTNKIPIKPLQAILGHLSSVPNPWQD